MALMALVIGLLLVVQGIVGLVAPDLFVSTLQFIQRPPAIYLTAVIRVLFGVVLIRAAPGSRAPNFLRVLGFIILIGGLLTPFVGIPFAHIIFDWWSAGGPGLVRGCAGFSLALGVGIVYAVAQNRRGSSP